MRMKTGTEADRGASTRWSSASVLLGVLSLILLFASTLHGRSWSLWRLPFVFGLFPVSVLPFALVRLGALLAALAAVAAGVVAVRRRVRVFMAVFGICLGGLTVALTGFLAFTYFSIVRDDVDLTACGKNLRHLDRDVLWRYADNASGFYPPLSSQPGVLMFSPKAVPSDESIGMSLTCPTIRKAKQPTTGPASPFDDQSYFYLGYAVLNDDDVEAFAQAYRKEMASGASFEGDLAVETKQGTKMLHRLRAGMAVNTDIQGGIPVFIERGWSHVRIENLDGRKTRVRGGRVVYMNGANRFVPQGTWPMTEKTQRILAELAQ